MEKKEKKQTVLTILKEILYIIQAFKFRPISGFKMTVPQKDRELLI